MNRYWWLLMGVFLGVFVSVSAAVVFIHYEAMASELSGASERLDVVSHEKL